MKKITYFALGCAMSTMIACQNDSSSIKYSEIDVMSSRGDGGETFVSDDNSNSSNLLEVSEGTLTAGMWNDLENWDFWQQLMQKETYFTFQNQWAFYPSQRYQVQLKDSYGSPVREAIVQLKNKKGAVVWEARTNHNGTAELWSQLYSENKDLDNTISIQYNKESHEIKKPLTFTQGTNEFKLETVAIAPENNADVILVVDATGSMEDEIAYMKAEFKDVINQVNAQKPTLNLQTGSVFYRDEGDEYVTRVSGLSSDATKVVDFMSKQSAEGGGDYPEAVDVALKAAIEDKNWSSSAQTRIVFLMLDAPAHNESIGSLQESIQKAAKKGIQIIPIASSGIDKKTEFLMRFFALGTNGSYVFLTDHSGVGNEHIVPTVGEYRVEYLNELMTRIITNSVEGQQPLAQ
jgi:hypothetical protein